MDIYQQTLEQTEEQFRRDVGITKEQFFSLVEKVSTLISEQQLRNPLKRRGRKDGLSIQQRLLLTLFYLRHYPTFASLAKSFGISESDANKIYHQMLSYLVRVLPVSSKKQLLNAEVEAVVIDVTEQPIERPGQKQRAYYSGKKKRHTIKVQLIVCLLSLSILSVVCAKGKTHDLTILKGSRPPIREEAEKLADKGYQGIKRLYANAMTPFKSTKKNP